MADFDWDALRAMWLDHTDRAVTHAAARYPGETFYVLVFMLDEELHGPSLAMQSLEGIGIDASQRAGDFYARQWSPFEWGERDMIDVPDGAAENVKLYRALGEHARSGSRADWHRAYERHERLIVEVAGVVAERARRKEGALGALPMTDDFVVFARQHDVRRPFEMARRTITPEVLARFFAADLADEAARASVAAMPEAERIGYLVSQLGRFDGTVGSEEAREQLVAIGAPAVDAVAARLGDAKVGWEAAFVLCAMGPVADAAAPALRGAARGKGPVAAWAARALGAMGRIDDLMALRAAGLDAGVVSGLLQARPYAYAPLTTLLDAGDAKTRAAIAEAMRPGSASYAPRPEDFAHVAAFASSPHEAIRKEVAIALGAGEWSREDAANAVSLLITMLDDHASEVRRLAANAAHERGHEASAALPALRARTTDRVKAVAEYATRAIVEIERDVARRR